MNWQDFIRLFGGGVEIAEPSAQVGEPLAEIGECGIQRPAVAAPGVDVHVGGNAGCGECVEVVEGILHRHHVVVDRG